MVIVVVFSVYFLMIKMYFMLLFSLPMQLEISSFTLSSKIKKTTILQDKLCLSDDKRKVCKLHGIYSDAYGCCQSTSDKRREASSDPRAKEIAPHLLWHMREFSIINNILTIVCLFNNIFRCYCNAVSVSTTFWGTTSTMTLMY